MRHYLALSLILAAAGCSTRLVRPKTVTVCQKGACTGLSDQAGRERLLTAVYGLLKEAKGGEIKLYAAEPGARDSKKEGVSFFVQGGPIPGRSTLNSLTVADVKFIDRDRSEVKAAFKNNATYVGVPVLCAGGEAVFSVTADEAVLSHSNFCTWLGIGNGAFRFSWSLDFVDADRGVASGYWSMKGRGLPLVGGGSGYLVARLRPEKPVAPAPAPAAPAPAPAPPARPEPVEEVETVSRAAVLALATRLVDENGDRLLQAGERLRLEVTARNDGEALASAVELRLSGEPALVRCLGEKRSLAAVVPGEAQTAVFECRLPAALPTATASLRVEAFASDARAASKLLKIGMSAGANEEEVEVVSETGVDEIPPRAKSGGSGNVALVVGVSRYREAAIPAVRWASRDAEVMARYLENVGGVAPEDLKLITDDGVTRSDLEAYLEDWLPRRVKPDSIVYVYFSGHGAPEPSGKESFIVPYEGHPDFPSKLFPLTRLYASLSKLKAKAAVVMLDSCFSGAKGRGVAQAGARPLVAQASVPDLAPHVSVIAGASGAQIGSDLDKAEHGLFTFYLLKGLRGEADKDGDGVVTLAELFPFVREGVSARASRELNRDQTPALFGGAAGAPLPLARR